MQRLATAALAGAVTLSLVFMADAADLGRGGSIKDAPPPPRQDYAEPYYNWQGLYAGGFVGGGSQDGVALGGWLGYNVMLSSGFVLGIEADIGTANAGNSDIVDTSRLAIDTFGSVRGRYGYAIDRFLVFGTAGFAFANLTTASANLLVEDKMQTGFAVGGGIEYAFTPSLVGRAEYIYSNYGDVSLRQGNTLTDLTNDMHLARVGLSYRF